MRKRLGETDVCDVGRRERGKRERVCVWVCILILNPTPYTLHPTPYTLHPTSYTMNPEP